MVVDKVKELLAEHLSMSVEKIQDSSKIIEDLGADSLDTVEMLMGLEEEFGISISDDEATKLKTVSDIIELVENKKNK